MKILCLGDSNTYGYDPRSYMGSRYPAEVRWTDRLASLLVSAAGTARYEVINAGINGMTAARAMTAFANRIRLSQPDLFIVMLGTNDLLVGATADDTAERIMPLLDHLGRTGKPVLLLAPPLLEYGEWVQGDDVMEESQELADLYRELASQKGFRFADTDEWGIELSFDGVHFSPAGHETFARRLAEELSQIL